MSGARAEAMAGASARVRAIARAMAMVLEGLRRLEGRVPACQ